jgi:hypothetical protein
MERLDHVPTRTRLDRRDASTTEKSLTRMTLGQADRPPHSPTLRQKSNHLMQPPTTSYPHGYSDNQHGSSTSVKSHFLLPIPGWPVKTYHCTRYAEHYSAIDPPRGRIRRVSYPEILGARSYPFPVDPPRPVLDPASTNHRSTKKQGLHATGSKGFSPSHPLRHHGVQGWPAILGARRYSGFHNARQNFTSKASPGISASS